MQFQQFFQELKRRNIFRVATAYAIAGWLIIQICTATFPYLNLPEWLITAVIVFVGIGFPIALIFAWAFEITPDGLKKSTEVEITESVTKQTGKKLNGVIISVLSIALFFVVVERVFFAKANILEDAADQAYFDQTSIAVLPFVNMSSDEENEFFSDGLSEELLNALAGIDEMKVAGRTSSFKFKGQNEDLKLIGEQLRVANILEGSVRKSGDRVRITAQLIRVEDGFHMWSETYDRELTANDIFDIQEEISRRVSQELKVRLLPEEEEQLAARPTQDIEAYNAFLEATQLEVSGELDDLLAAVEKYKMAIRIDSNFSLAYGRLALVYGDLNWEGNLSLDEMKDLMRDNIDRAFLINGNEGKAFEALGYYYLNIEDNQKALETYERAIELLPGDSEVLVGYHDVLHEIGRHQESHEILLQAYDIDPLNPDIGSHLGNHFVSLGDPERGLELFEKVLDNYPDFYQAKINKANAYAGIGVGEIGKAFISIYELYKQDPENVNFIVRLHGLSESLGLYPIQEYFVNRMGELYPNNQQYYFMYANFYADHGDIDEILEFVDTQRGIFSDEFNKEIDTFKARLTYMKGDRDEAVEMYTKVNEWILGEDLSIESVDQLNDVGGYLSFSNGAGIKNQERFDYLTDLFCEYAKQDHENAQFEAVKKYTEWRLGECEFFKGDQDAFIEIITKSYFDYKIKGGFPPLFHTSRNFASMEGNPKFQAMKRDIKTDLNGMSEEVISFLKTEGEWRDEWGMEN